MSELHWIDEIAPYTEDDQARIMAHLNGKHSTREVRPGVWEHTFTPKRTLSFEELMYSEPPADAKQPTLAELDEMLEEMFANARAQPDMLYVSIDTMRQVRHIQRIGRLYRALPVPHRKIRKCHMRKLQARWRKGVAHIRRVEQAEIAREEAEMRRLREEQPK